MRAVIAPVASEAAAGTAIALWPSPHVTTCIECVHAHGTACKSSPLVVPYLLQAVVPYLLWCHISSILLLHTPSCRLSKSVSSPLVAPSYSMATRRRPPRTSSSRHSFARRASHLMPDTPAVALSLARRWTMASVAAPLRYSCRVCAAAGAKMFWNVSRPKGSSASLVKL